MIPDEEKVDHFFYSTGGPGGSDHRADPDQPVPDDQGSGHPDHRFPRRKNILNTVLCVDSLRIEKGFVRKNQSLSDILSFYNIAREMIHYIATTSRPVFDVRKMRSGNPYTVIFSKDTLPEMLYFIYEEDPVNYITYQLKEPVNVTRGAKPVVKDTTVCSGVIESSLWNALEDEGIDPNLANEMSEVYAWTIDFFGIQRGDYFKVMYEKMSVEGEVIGIGKVLSAVFIMGERIFMHSVLTRMGKLGIMMKWPRTFKGLF